MEFKDLINESGLEFADISSEKIRSYLKGNAIVQSIENPIAVNVSSSGGHRVIDAKGRCYYFKPESWDRLIWHVKEGHPHFVK